MIFLRAFPFSLSILWRYLIALPALIIALAGFAFIAFILVALAMLVSPFIGILFAVAFAVGSSVIPVMVGLRVGLQSYFVKPRVSYLGMMKPALGYGLFEAVVMVILLAFSVGAFLLLTPLSLNDFLVMDVSDEEAMLDQLTAINPTLTWALVGFVGLAGFALRSALLVPFAGASVGADPDGRQHTPFYGFGSGFGAVFALVLISQIGLAFSLPLAFWGLSLAGVAQNAAMQLAEAATYDELSDLAGLGPDALILIGVTLLILLYFFSLQCAGAVLVYMRKRGIVGARRKAFDEVMQEEEARAAPMADTDLLALVRSRMPDKKY